VRVGVVAGSVQETLARDRHWPVEAASSFETSVLALRARRFELLLSARESLPLSQLSGEDALVELAPLVERLPYFAPASRAVHAQHPEFVADFWRELCLPRAACPPSRAGRTAAAHRADHDGCPSPLHEAGEGSPAPPGAHLP
jgi:hypothetical protein